MDGGRAEGRARDPRGDLPARTFVYSFRASLNRIPPLSSHPCP